ncbi:hypothetical protein D3875_00680 [Deinococcus cavernae]|uniref:DUF3108 domain-containing protein n=1 Tax=Deinococcus cavernae TaxID=2320857 RepID=A0A418VHP6_9DEIO|nr:hypothetical protein [Deinococcus cavernae]RJF75597.1 hypothetical protein D3875_00680 [Deinococcus cavernae]
MKFPALIAVFTIFSAASAQAAIPVTYETLAIAPETQELEITAWLDSGFPEGQVFSTIRMNCSGDGKPVVTGYKQDSMGDWQPDSTKTAASQKVTAIKLAPGAITIPNLAGDLKFVCKDKKLVTDYSKFNNPNATFIARSSNNDFDIKQDSLMPKVRFEYPLTSTRYQGGSIISNSVTLSLLGRGFKKVSGIEYVDYTTSDQKTTIFVFDAKKNVLIPAYYNKRSDPSKLKNYVVGDRLELYYAPDYTIKTGWRKLTVDFKNSLIWTEDVSMPNSRIAN